MILPLLTTVHSFLYVHIRFRTFRIAIKPNWNNYYNISNAPTTLYLSLMKRISGSHYFLDMFINPTIVIRNGKIPFLMTMIRLTALFLTLVCTSMWMEVCSMLRHVYVRRTYSSIAKDLKFDWSIQVTWKQRAYSLVQQHESWQILQLFSFLIPAREGGLFLRNRLLYYFESLFTATCSSSSK